MANYKTKPMSAAVFMTFFLFAGCGGNTPSAPTTGEPQAPQVFPSPSSAGVPRAPQVLSTNAPYTFHTYAIPNCAAAPGSNACFPHGIGVGPDRLYYTLYSSNLVGSVSYGGVMGPQIAAPGSPNDIAEGENGAMYVALQGNAGLGELAEDGFGGSVFGSWNDFGVTTAGTSGVLSDPNGVIWYLECNNSSVVRMTTYGSLLSRTALVPGSFPGRAAVAADRGSVYVTEEDTNKIAKFDLNGNLLSETPVTAGSRPIFITAGQDGNMYFTEYYGDNCTGGGYIGQLTPSGNLTMFPISDCAALGITSATDGNIWFTETQRGKIAQFNVSTHAITEYTIPASLAHPYAIVSGADGQLWFTTQNSPYIASFQP